MKDSEKERVRRRQRCKPVSFLFFLKNILIALQLGRSRV